LKSVKGEIFGGLTAAVVALPLALAFGVASGLGPVAGLYGAIVVGFFAAVFGGTPAQVSGPTGPMTVVTASVVALYADSPDTVFLIICLGGLLQIGFGLLGVGRYISYTPYSVISGFLSGIGVIIMIPQLLALVGADAAGGGLLAVLQLLPAAVADANLDAAGIGVIALLIMIFWPKWLGRYLPAPLTALLVGSALGLTLLPAAPVIGEVPTGLPQFRLPGVAGIDIANVIQPAFVLALLGSIDSLLTSLVADTVTRTHHNSNRELLGQGIGNVAAGLFGAVPGAGATMRTLVNVRAGGRTPFSGVLHAVVLLSLVLGFASFVTTIPYAALAGILLKVGWDIVDWEYLKRIRRAPREKVFVMLVTLGLTVFVDLITAVGIGLIIAGFATARWMETEELKGVTAVALSKDDALSAAEHAALEKHGDAVVLIALRGRYSYASARELAKRIGTATSGYKVAILDFSDDMYIDTSAAMAIREIVEGIESEGIHCIVSGLSGMAEQTLNDLGALDKVDACDRAADKARAIERAANVLQD